MEPIQIISIVGALLILSAYGANQLGRLGPDRLSYSLLNLAGSAILAAIAIAEQQWGFLLLEGVWVVVSFWGAWKRVGTRPSVN